MSTSVISLRPGTNNLTKMILGTNPRISIGTPAARALYQGVVINREELHDIVSRGDRSEQGSQELTTVQG